MEMRVREAFMTDLDEVMSILNHAADFLRDSGSPQWSNQDRPTKTELKHKIKSNLTYVLLLNNQIVATATLNLEEEAGYADIKYGSWQDMVMPYVSIHRFAVSSYVSGRGYAKLFLDILVKLLLEQGLCDIRIDTHPQNKSMQQVVSQTGFIFSGVIELPVEHGERYAYQYGLL